MDTEQLPAPAAPAQPADPTPPIESATHAAARLESTHQYREARRAERLGRPLPDVPASPAPPVAADPEETADTPAAVAQPERPVSKRQQTINDYERRIAEYEQRLRALETRSTPAAPAQPDAPAAPQTPEWKRYREMPDAPKLADFDSVEDHTAAMSLFIADRRMVERQQRSQQEQMQAQRERFIQERSEKFRANIQEAAAADPAFASSLPPDLLHAKPLSALAPNERPRLANLIAEVAQVHSEHPAAFYRHLGNHDVAAAIAQLPPQQWMPVLLQIDGELRAARKGTPSPAAASAPPAIPITRLPPPPQTLGTKPSEATDPMVAAVKSNSTTAYRQLRRQQRLAQMGRH